MSILPEEDQNTTFKKRLDHYVQEIRFSYIHDVDKTDVIIKVKNFIKVILESDEPLEHHFNNNEQLLKYFMTTFLKNIISNILAQNIVYGDDGDDIAVDLLYNIYKLFLKFHKEVKYAELFETIREMIKPDNSVQNFFKPLSDQRTSSKIENIKRRYNSFTFNHKYCKEFIDSSKEPKNIYKIGDRVDVLITNKKSRTTLDRKAWVRGIIESIDEENYQYIVICESINETVTIQMGGGEITSLGEKTADWDWRLGLKKFDVIDCYDRNKWYPSTITSIKSDGTYRVGFRLYPKHFKNEEDENDTYENYKCFWNGQNIFLDKKKEECFGDQENYDEDINFYSKRIQKFKSYSSVQKNFLDTPIQYYASGYAKQSDSKNQMQQMNYELENDEAEIESNEDMMLFEVNGKKNYIIGKKSKFCFYYAVFWKKLADDNIFEDFIEIINNKPNAEEIYTILYTIYCAIPYLHKKYLIDNLDNFKNAIMNFINNLDTKEIRNLPKNISDIFFKFLKSINEILIVGDSSNDKNIIKTIDEISISLAIKMLKTSIFDKRMQGIKSLTEFINDNELKEETMQILINLIQQNEIIKEIFGANYHSQIISKSDKILSLLLKNNKVKEEDIKLIWDCTQRGDLEVKNIIMKLLSDLAGNLNENFINILLENVINKIDGDKMNEKDIDFIYNLSIHGDNKNNKNKCCEYLYQCVLKLDVNVSNEYEIKMNPIMNKLLTFAQNDEKYLSKILSLCEQDLKINNKSLSILQILSILFDSYTYSYTELIYLKESIKDFVADEKLLNLYKNNFINYIERIKEQIKSKKDLVINPDEEIIDNYSHTINIKKRIEFLNKWITLIYPAFDFVPFLKEILLSNPVSQNDEIIFYEFIQKYISESSLNENKIRKEKKDKMKEQLFQNFIENDQSNMTFSEFKLFISIFLGINSSNICYLVDKDDNYDISLSCQSVEDIKDLDKLWNVFFQIKEEKVLNKAISIIFNIYKSVNQIEKLLNKCKELIKEDENNNNTDNNFNINEAINKCFKLLRMIILESEKNIIIKTKSHFNLLKNCYTYLPLKLVPKYANYIYYNNHANISQINNNKTEVLYGNTTINELKELLIEKGKLPLKNIEIYLSKEYMNSIKNTTEENEFQLDETYNNKSLMEILDNNYNVNMPLDKIFIFYSKNVEKESLLINNELNPVFERILKEWFAEFTNGEEKMDMEACSNYITKVTGVREMTSIGDDRVTDFFNEYDKEKTGFITEEKFLEFYLDALKTQKEDTVWENLKNMGIREDLHKMSDEYPIPYSDNNLQPRYTLGNDNMFINNLFSLYDKCEKKKEIFEFLFFLATNENMYDNILNNLNKENENNFEKIFFNEKNNILLSLYNLIIIESILQDINIDYTNFDLLKNKFITNENGIEFMPELSSKKYEYFDEIDINIKKDFLKNFIINKNYEKLLKYMNELLINYKFDQKGNNEENFIINLCCEKCINIVNIIYNAIKEKHFSENEIENNYNNSNNNIVCIIPFDYNNLFNFIKTEDNIKQTIEQINFVEYATNLIKFVSQANKEISTEDNDNNNRKNYLLLQNSFTLLINLISDNDKLISELYANAETKKTLENLLKAIFNTNNETYKLFYINCLLNSTKNSEKNSKNKFLNLLFELTNDIIFNQIMKDDYTKKDSDKSSIIFFDFFSILTSKLEDNIGNEFLFQIYQFLFNKLEHIEEDKNISKNIYVGLMNILIKRIKYNEEIKNIFISKEIKGKTLLDLILDKFYKSKDNKKEEKKEKESVAIEINSTENKETKETKEEPLFINLETLKQKKSNIEKKEIPKEIEEICSQYLLSILKSSQNENILNKILSIIKTFSSDKSEEQKEENILKKHKSPPSFKKHDHVGLKNLGCICYMNSILQQVYMVPTFRYAIMGYQATPLNDPSSDDPLHQLQIMYSYLTLSEKEDYNPKNFCNVFKDFDGNPINIMVQQDSQEFFNNFFDKMENYLRNNKYKYIINDVFVGRTCSSVICDSCKHVSNRFEDFYNLTLEVKNINNLNDSLHKLIMPEKIDDFKCSNCNQNVTINKRTSLSDLPNVLVFHLKRFYMNYEIERTEKINSRFEFPFSINMKEFCIEDIDFSGKKFENDDIYIKEDSYYLYELKGINIHMGSADGGHYFSVINILRDGEGNILLEKKGVNNEANSNKNNWLKFNDSHISVFDINDIEKECFGGSSKGLGFNYENFQNAYMLIYERKKKTPIRLRYDENEIKEICNLEKEENNIIKLKSENKAAIKKMYNLAKKDSKIDENDLYKKVFNDEDKKEYYKYIPFYSIEKIVPKYLYEQITEKNVQLHKLKNEESEEKNHKKDYYDILINSINTSEFNIFNYNEQIKSDLLNLLIEELFPKDKYLYDEDKLTHNKKAKIILEKIILPIINLFTNENEEENKKNYKLIAIISTLICQKERMKRIFTNDISVIFDNSNVEIFYEIIKSLINIHISKNSNKYLSIVEYLINIIQETDSIESYPKNISNNTSEETALYYVYKLIYEIALKNKKITNKLINQSCISELLGKLTSENKRNKNIIFDIVLFLLKNLDDYNDILFDVEKKEKTNTYFHEKHYLIRNISPIFIEVLFNEKVELLIILLKLLQYNEPKFSKIFNSQNLLDLFAYSTKKNKMSDMNKVLFGILEINDKCTFDRLNYILGYPTLIIKELNYGNSNKTDLYIKKELDGSDLEIAKRDNLLKDFYLEQAKKDSLLKDFYLEKAKKASLKTDLYLEKDKKDISKTDLYLEEAKKDISKTDLYLKEAKRDSLITVNKKNKNKYKWPLFGERLIQGIGKLEDKLDRHIFKYISYSHEHDDFCLLSRLMPEIDEYGKIVNKNNQLITDKQRKDLIYDLFKLMLLGKGNYCIFKYIYLSPARCIKYNNLYEEMLDILEQENNSLKNNIYDLSEIKSNAEICIKRINYEVDLALKYLKGENIIDEEIKYELPEKMKKYFVQNDDVDKFIGSNPNYIPGDIVEEKILTLTHEGGLYLMRLEYITELKTREEIKNRLQIGKKLKMDVALMDIKKRMEEIQKERIKIKQNKQEDNMENNIKQEKEEDQNLKSTENIDNESSDSDSDSTHTIDISKVNYDLDKKDFLREVLRKYLSSNRQILSINNTSTSNKKSKAKSSLIRFVMLNLTSQQSPMEIEITQKDIPYDVKENFYYQLEFSDLLRREEASNFLNIYRIRNDLPFLKKRHIGINIDIKKSKQFGEV